MGEKRKRSDDPHSEVRRTSSSDWPAVDAECWEAEVVLGALGETQKKRQKAESAEPLTPQPLTRENLALLEGKMPGKRSNDGGKAGGSKTGITKSTPTKSTVEERLKAKETVAAASTSQNLAQTRRNFEKNRLFINDDKAVERCPQIMVEVRKIIDETRNSAMKAEEQKDIGLKRNKMEFRSEADFVEVIWNMLIHDTRTVNEPPVPNEDNASELILKRWDKSGLELTRRKEFKANCIPKVDTEGDAILEALLNLMPRIANPVPDLAYGLDEALFTADERNVLDLEPLKPLTRLSDVFYNTFCVMEFKSYQGTIQEAEMQACRGGSAMVNAMRQLKIKANELGPANAYDVGSISWSVVMIPTEAELFVHWAEECPDKRVNYHMQLVESYRLRGGKDAPNLRKNINNILDWAVELRLDYMKNLVAKIRTELTKPDSLSSINEGSEQAKEGEDAQEKNTGGSPIS